MITPPANGPGASESRHWRVQVDLRLTRAAAGDHDNSEDSHHPSIFLVVLNFTVNLDVRII